MLNKNPYRLNLNKVSFDAYNISYIGIVPFFKKFQLKFFKDDLLCIYKKNFEDNRRNIFINY